MSLYGKPADAPEGQFSELLAVADFYNNLLVYPIGLVLRWPCWPLWKRTHGGHESQSFSELGRLFFDWLCVAGLAAQGFSIFYLVVEPLYHHTVLHLTEGLWSLAAFAALTAARIGVWFYVEVWQKW